MIRQIKVKDLCNELEAKLVKVTEIYSKTSVKMKREAIEKMDKKDIVPTDKKEWNEDTELMTWLKSL